MQSKALSKQPSLLYQKVLLLIISSSLFLIFSISSDLYNEIASTVTIIYHIAAFVNHYLGYEDHRAADVIGTLNVLRLAATSQPKVLLHVRVDLVAAYLLLCLLFFSFIRRVL